jgi:hypothetical protein
MGRPENYFDLFIQTHPKERGTIMSRILHCSSVPLTIDYWDYYILCRLDIEAARVLQRMEYWDGTKGDQLPDASAPSEAATLSDTASEDNRYFWKSEEELHWELMGSIGEKRLSRCLHTLVEDYHYLTSRRNPFRGFDRTRQYALQARRIQDHLARLQTILTHFLEAGRHIRPVQYAIEELTREGVTIEQLSVELVAKKLSILHELAEQDASRHQGISTPPGQPSIRRPAKAQLPTFVRLALKKDEQRGFCAAHPLCISSTSIPPNCGMDTAHLRHRCMQIAGIEEGSSTNAIPERTSSQNTFHPLHTEGYSRKAIEHVPTQRACASPATQSAAAFEREGETESTQHERIAMLSEAETSPIISTSPAPLQATLVPASTSSPKQHETGLDTIEIAKAEDLTRSSKTEPLTTEAIVALVERKRGMPYDAATRSRQLEAARHLLAMHFPLDAVLLERIYDECCDQWWHEHMGELHVSHLIERERRHGQPRILRLLKRVQSKDLHQTARATRNAAIAGGSSQKALPLPLSACLQDKVQTTGFTITGESGPYGWTGWGWSADGSEQLRLVTWNGQIMLEDEAYQHGYYGGWERFRPGTHPDDDLDAAYARLVAQGKLPGPCSMQVA